MRHLVTPRGRGRLRRGPEAGATECGSHFGAEGGHDGGALRAGRLHSAGQHAATLRNFAGRR